MARRSNKPAELRDSWRLRAGPNTRRRLLRLARRLAITLVVAVLLAGLYYALFSPFWHPNTHLVSVAATDYRSLGLSQIRFAREDAAALLGPLAGVTRQPSDAAPVELAAPDDFPKLAERLQAASVGSDDVFIVSLSAHGLVVDGEAYLLCDNFDVAAPREGRYPLRSLLELLRQSPAAVKLLLLDAGRLDFDPRLGVVVNEFPRLLQAEVEKTGDAGLWVLAANSPLERSHTASAVRQSVFGHFTARGLRGEADRNADQLVDLGELFQFVRTNVAGWVKNAGQGHERQTPMLLRGAPFAADEQRTFPVLLSVSTVTPAPSPASDDAPPAPQPTATPSPPAPVPSATPTATAPAIAQAVPAPTGSATGTKPVPPSIAATVPEPTATIVAIPSALLQPIPASTATKSVELATPTLQMNGEQLAALGRQAIYAAESRAGAGPTPIDDALPAWREATSEYERLIARGADGSLDRRAWETQLRRFTTDLVNFHRSGAPAPEESALARAVALRAPPSLNSRIPSWAMVERIAVEHGPAPPAALADFLRLLDAALIEDDRQAFDALVGKPWPPAAEGYFELHFARRLAGLAAPWPLVQLAWRACREGEQVAADAGMSREQFAARIAAIDRVRAAAFTELFDQIGADWNDRAAASLQAAVRGYRDIAVDLGELRRALELRNDGLDRADAYVGWYVAAAGDPGCGPRYDDLVRYLSQLQDFALLLEGDELDVPTLAASRVRLELLRNAIESAASAASVAAVLRPGDTEPTRRSLEILLASGLVTPDVRRRIDDAVAEFPAAPANLPTTPYAAIPEDLSRVTTPQEWTAAGRRIELARALSALAEAPTTDPAQVETPALAALRRGGESAVQQQLAAGNESKLWEEVRSDGARAASKIISLPDLAERLVGTTAAPEGPADLRLADRLTRRADLRDVVRLATRIAGPALRRAELFRGVLLGRNRLRQAAEDASPTEVAYLRSAADAYRDLINELNPGAARADDATPPYRITGPTELSLADEPRRELPITVESQGIGKVWIVLEYDPELFEVRMPPPTGVYERHALEAEITRRTTNAEAAWRQVRSLPASSRPADAKEIEIRAERAASAALYPPTPAEVGLPPTTQLDPGERRSYTFDLRRRGTAARRSKVVVKVIGELPQGKYAHVRHETLIGLPSLETISFNPVGGSGSWSRSPDGIVLHPLPNRTTDYEFQVANLGTADKLVDVEFIAPERHIETTLPSSVKTLAISEVLQLVGPSQTLVKIDELNLPAGGTPLTLARPKPKEEGEPPPKEDERNKPQSNVGTEAPADGKEPPPIPVRHGMLMILRERAGGNTLIKRIDFRPQRPRRYVQADVGYNAALERIEVRVSPIDRRAIPPEGCKVRIGFPEPLARGTEAQLEGVLQAPDYAALLYVQAPLSESRVQTVYLDVDDYPRAFTYRVPCGAASRRLPEVADDLNVTITAPEPGTMFAAPAASVPVELKVDAPVGAFDNDRDVLEVGIDVDRDRDLRNENALRLQADRQAEIFLKSFGTNGIVTFRADVHDFKLLIPAGALQNARANLLAKVLVGPSTAFSPTVEIGLDGAPPEVGRVELLPGRTVTQGVPLDVEVSAVDAELSGVAKVEIGFDLAGQGKFNEAAPAVPAKQESHGRWTAKLPTANLPLGKSTMLVRATDKVGNAGELVKLDVTVVSAAEAAAIMKGAGSRVAGTVRYGGDPLAGARVALLDPEKKELAFAETDVRGFFAIEGAPAGTFTLTARGLARNRPRTAEQPLTIPPPPAKVPRLDIDVK